MLLTVRWLRWVVAAAAAVATLLRSFEWILKRKRLVEWILTKLMYISIFEIIVARMGMNIDTLPPARCYPSRKPAGHMIDLF